MARTVPLKATKFHQMDRLIVKTEFLSLKKLLVHHQGPAQLKYFWTSMRHLFDMQQLPAAWKMLQMEGQCWRQEPPKSDCLLQDSRCSTKNPCTQCSFIVTTTQMQLHDDKTWEILNWYKAGSSTRKRAPSNSAELLWQENIVSWFLSLCL